VAVDEEDPVVRSVRDQQVPSRIRGDATG